MVETLFELLKTYGVMTGLVIFFILWNFVREKTLSARLTLVEDYQRNELAALVKENVRVIAENSQASKEVVSASREQIAIIRDLKTHCETIFHSVASER